MRQELGAVFDETPDALILAGGAESEEDAAMGFEALELIQDVDLGNIDQARRVLEQRFDLQDIDSDVEEDEDEDGSFQDHLDPALQHA